MKRDKNKRRIFNLKIKYNKIFNLKLTTYDKHKKQNNNTRYLEKISKLNCLKRPTKHRSFRHFK